jgi:hypothetical protein
VGRLPEIRRILREDIKEAPSWIEKLLTPLNSFMSVVYENLNKNITFRENIACQIKEMEFETLATYSSLDWTLVQFKGLSYKATGVLLMQLYEKADTYIPIKKAVSIDWLDLNGSININYISGLENSKKYFARFLVI